MTSSYGAPPGRWQADTPLPEKGLASAGASAASGHEDAHNAWKHIKSVVKEDGKGVDLYDLFYQGGSRENQYSHNPAGVRTAPHAPPGRCLGGPAYRPCAFCSPMGSCANAATCT